MLISAWYYIVAKVTFELITIAVSGTIILYKGHPFIVHSRLYVINYSSKKKKDYSQLAPPTG